MTEQEIKSRLRELITEADDLEEELRFLVDEINSLYEQLDEMNGQTTN